MATSDSSYSDGVSGDVQARQTRPTIKLNRGKPAEANPSAVRVRNLYTEAVKSTRDEVSTYWINYAFINGNQWVTWDPDNHRISDLPRDPDKSRLKHNRMASNTRSVLSRAMQRHLTFEVLPNAADDAHIRGARISETILRALHRHHDWEVIRERHLQAVWKGGTGAICVDWDPQAQDILIPATEQGDPAVYEGDTCETVLSIAEFVVEPGSRDPERARWWIKALTLPPKAVQAQYELEWEPAADGYSAQLPYQSKYASTSPEDGDVTLVLTYYERPNHLNEKGKICVVVNDQIVHEAEWPFPDKDRLNLFVARETVVENKWTGTTILTEARAMQTALNAAETQIHEHMKRAGTARLFVPQSAMEIIEQLTDTAGEVIAYPDNGGAPPSYGSPPQMPNWWNERPEKLMSAMDDIMGVHDVTRGEAPANIESGYGISILTENDNTPVGRLVKETIRVWSDVASFCLKLYEQEAKTTRKTPVQVPGQPPMTLSWSGKDLAGQTLAIVPEDAVLPRSRAAQAKFAETAVTMGMIQPGDIASYAALAEMPDQRHILEVTNPDLASAKEENGIMAAGGMTEVQDFEDHEAHIAQHNRFRKSSEFRRLDPQQKEYIKAHIEAHEMMLVEELGRQRAKSQMDPALGLMGGATGAPPVEPLPPVEAPQGAPGEEAALPGLPPEAPDDILAAIQAEMP